MVALLVAGCDSGPDGPGDLVGSVQSPASSLGGVVIEVVGPAIEDFSGEGGTKVFWARQEDPVVFRVIAIGDGGGALNFTASVQERAGKLPRATVISAVDSQNRPLPVTKEYKVRFRR
jgi:hypothetical protein